MAIPHTRTQAQHFCNINQIYGKRHLALNTHSNLVLTPQLCKDNFIFALRTICYTIKQPICDVELFWSDEIKSSQYSTMCVIN